MKFCPTCETRYDEEILRFCTKDGTPLVDENQPNFTEMPSESVAPADDDLGEDTMVRYKPPKDLLEPEPQPDIDRSEAPRIVIPMTEQKKEQNVRARNIPPYQPPTPKSNTGKIVALTIFGTLVILAFGLGLFWFLRNEDSGNNKNALNINTSPVNLNTNINAGGVTLPTPTNLNFNSNSNINFNSNINSNVKTPTPTPKPSPSPTPTANTNVNANIGNINIIGTPTPKPSPSNTPTPRITLPPPGATPRLSPTPDRSGRPPGNENER
jgi:hypothetical protein